MDKAGAVEGITINDVGNRPNPEFVLAVFMVFNIIEPGQEISSASSSFSC